MNNNTMTPAQQKPLRLWPGVAIVMVQWILRFVVPELFPDALAVGIMGAMVLGLGVGIWWLFFSRAARFDRWLVTALVIGSLVVTFLFLDKSITTANVGLMFAMFSIPVMSLAFVAWAVASRWLPANCQRTTMIATIVLASGFWVLLRTDGMDASIHHDLKWRWSKTAEERLLAQSGNKLNAIAPDSITLSTEAEWPGFRGHNRDGIIHGEKIGTDWSAKPPVELWRHPVGPACSSFAVQGNLFYTQEQRGENEMISCYNLNTGEPVWQHSDSTRFWDAHAGAGPRSTPTLSNGRVYTLGATGILNVLDERTGSLVWSRNAANDTKVQIPGWAYTSSPLVVDSLVVIAISGQILAYDLYTGKPCWSGTDGGESYCSPHLFTFDGVKQILFANKEGLASYALSDGSILWKLDMPGIPIVQPALVSDNDLLICQGDLKGMRRVTVSRQNDTWTVQERWKTTSLKPNHNDLVIHKGYAYGIDMAGIFCVDLQTGERKWKGSRYGGQLLLLADQDLLVVLTEKGEVALVEAKPEQFNELARMKAIEGKTWNHPVLVKNILMVRNTEEMAAFRL